MQICTLASSSSGNSALLIHEQIRLLIDAGISLRRLSKSMKEINISLEDLDGILITHEHSDHICGLPMICKKYSIPVFAPAGVAEGILEFNHELEPFLQIIPVGIPFSLGNVTISAFHTPHDVRESVGYRITANKRVFAIATDLGHVSAEVLTALIGTDTVILEANHDANMLKTGPYPFSLKKRILSDYGHLSNRMCGILAKRLYEEGTKCIILAHMSKENNTPDLAYAAVDDALRQAGAVPGENVSLLVAPRSEHSKLMEV